jgi:hypothetical protein
MSFKGEIEAKCPGGCEPFEAEVWSFIRGDRSVELRDAILARECNLILCPSCNKAFIPEEPYVYFEPQRELLAFVFPESYREKEQFWREKMASDFVQMKETLGDEISLDLEPEIFFGIEELAQLLEGEDYAGEEREVAEFIAGELGLALYRVSPRYAREHRVPASLPYAGKAKAATASSVIAGLEKLVAANDRLTAFAGFLKTLKAQRQPSLPPASQVKTAA